jgi:6-phospho-beta-glucosidase
VNRAGGNESRRLDEHIAFKHGVVGAEQNGPVGTINALRAIHLEMRYARIAENLAPDAWFINYTNPASFVAEALQRFTKINSIGECSLWPERITSIAWAFRLHYERIRDLFPRIRVVSFGSNQNMWVKDVYIDGKNVTNEWIERLNQKERTKKESYYGLNPAEEKIALRKLTGMDSLWYIMGVTFFAKYDLDEWNRTGRSRSDYVVPLEERHFEEAINPRFVDVTPSVWERSGVKDLKEALKEKKPGLKRPLNPSDLKEGYNLAAPSVVNAIANDTGESLVCQVQSRGTVEGMEDYMVQEVLCEVDKRGPHPIPVGVIPKSIRGIVLSAAYWQSLTVEAAIEGSYDKALLALLNCPHIQHPEKFKISKKILDEYLRVHREYLPEFTSESGLYP